MNFFKKLTLLAIIFTCFNMQSTLAQVRNCSAMEHLEHLQSIDPKMQDRMERIENHTRIVMQNADNERVDGVITIPVVVHVIYSNSNENISDAQIQSQIDVLNEDFRRTNSDADNTWSQAVDTEIAFCLASVDPSGNATTGITRKSSSTTSWGTNDAMKSSSNGGVDAWPAGDYLNMWVCNIGGGILGYAQFPGGSAATDGVVVSPQYFGRTGYVSAPFNLGRTMTHEVGHWLNLRHIWGDGNCSADDFVSDTPTSDAANYGCATGHVSCSSTDMVQNYMDYSDDACMNLFTAGQKARMRALFETGGFRASLLNSNACGAPAEPTCEDGIMNGGETGVDCGGSCAACPTCDDGIMNGGETGIDCRGSCAACPCTGTQVTVSITLDNYPEETSWSIVDANGTTVASGGTYNNEPDGSTVTVTNCLADGCYDFVINDAYGDGICCGYGNGSYSVTDANGNSLASGASFSSSETTNFCLGGGPAPTCEDGVLNGDETGVDCGGSCAACPTCDDGVLNGDETGVDCGGSCAACPTCDDGVLNGDETGIDCGGSCSPCDTGGPCSYIEINSNNFDSGWGIWNDGGSDCRRSARDAAYANSGNRCVRLRDNTSTSTMTTDNLDLSTYEEITVDFTYLARSMDNSNEDFWFQISTDGGASYTTVEEWNRGDEFENDIREFDAVTVAGPFSTNTRLRFRCDASGNSDWVYIDDVVISGCTSASRAIATETITVVSEVTTVKETSTRLEENVPAISVNVYPNPASDMVTIDYTSFSTTQVRVFDINGRPVMQFNNQQETGKLQLDVSNFAKGYYFIQIDNGISQQIAKLVIM